jgi:hypothetical protein
VLPRVWNFVAGGLLMGFVLYMTISMFTLAPVVWVLPVGWVVLGLLTARSASPWSNTWLFLAIASFALPLVTFAFSALWASRDPLIQTDGAAAAGAAIGGLLVSGVGAFFGFFMGVIFALLAYFTRRNRRPVQ